MTLRLINKRFKALKPHLDERMLRLVAAAEAKAIGHGGVTAVSRATGISRKTVTRGMEELENLPVSFANRTRRRGGGRKRETEKDGTLIRDLKHLMEPVSRGNPAPPLQWTCKGLRVLAQELKVRRHSTSHRMVGELLHKMGYRFQVRAHAPKGVSPLNRHEWFERIYHCIRCFHRENLPVLSVSIKKSELEGGRPLHAGPSSLHEPPERFEGRILEEPDCRPVTPDDTTYSAAMESIRRWWISFWSPANPGSNALLVIADGGSGVVHSITQWKNELQKFADESGLYITVLRLPTGMRKWQHVKSRYISFIKFESANICSEYETILTVIGDAKQHKIQDNPLGSEFVDVIRRTDEIKCRCLRREEEHDAYGFTLVPFYSKTH